MLRLGREATGVGCTLVIMGTEVDVDGTDVEADGEGVEMEGSGVGTGVDDSVGVVVMRGAAVSLASRITRSYDVLVPPSSKITSRVLRAKDPKVRRARVCMSVAGLVLQGITGG